MKTLIMKNIDEIFVEYALTAEEMICVKGGDQGGEPIVMPCPPPVRI
jgi:hypothetical protein